MNEIRYKTNKTEYFINQAKEIHGDKYDYSKFIYKTALSKSTIKCKIHGDFEQNSNKHLSGCGCPFCVDNKILNLEKYLIRLPNNFLKLFDYSKSFYKGAHIKMMIICNKCEREFYQTPTNHKKSGNCPYCNLVSSGYSKTQFKENSKNRECIFYILKCWGEEEEFYKIGITSLTVKKRYSSKFKMPYSYEIIKEIKGTAEEIWDLENAFKKKYKDSRYEPKIKFAGFKKECYKFKLYENITTY